MDTPHRWITPREAATLARRDISRIYTWIREQRLTTRNNGTIHVDAAEILELEARMRRRNPATRRNQTRQQQQRHL